jgi:RNA polymerase sigma-70 factor (ECF subfamily)
MTRQHAIGRTDLDRPRREDTELVASLCAGDSEALGEVYLVHRKAVHSVIARIVVDRSVADDLTQETFLVLPQALKNFRGGCMLRTFITSIAVNLARHHTRTAIRRRLAITRFTEFPGSSPVFSPEQLLAQRQLGAVISQALSKLSPAKQETFLLREYHEHSSLETAQLTHAPEATVRTRVHHARRMLREALAHQGYESAA